LGTIDSTISTLHRLSLAIRKASNRNALAKVPKLLDVDIGYTVVRLVQKDLSLLKSSVDPIQFEVATGFEEFLRRVLKSRWFRSDSETTLDLHQEEYRELLFRRCITLISSRRRQLSYFQNHQTKLAMPRQIKTTALVQKPAKITDNATSPSNAERLIMQRPSIHKFLDTPRSETAATDLNVQAFRTSPSTAAPSSAASASEVGGLGTAGTFEVPSAPKLGKGEKEKMCPYCCLVFPDQLFSTHKKSRKWKKHLLEDMQPYICMFKNCDQTGKSYRSFKEWQAHLKKPHDQDWVCPLSHPHTNTNEEQKFIFETVEQFQNHLNAAHADLEDSSTHNILRTASQPAALPQWCFVCLAEQTNDVALQRHVANHLESAFLLALPGRDDIEESNEDSMGKPSTATTGTGTVQHFESDLPDLRNLYNDNPDEITTEATNNISSDDFASQLSTLNAMSTSLEERVGMLDGRRSDRTDLVEAPRLSQSWRALITVVMFLVQVRKKALKAREIHDSESSQEIIWEDIYRKAFLCAKECRWQEAEGWAWYIADAFEKYEGDGHPCTLMSLANLASVFAFQERWVEAGDLEERVMKMRQKVLGMKHPDTLTVMHNLASTYANLDRWKEAELLLTQVVEGQKGVLGDHHYATTTSTLSLVLIYLSQGKNEFAKPLLDQILNQHSSRAVLEGRWGDPITQKLLDRAEFSRLKSFLVAQQEARIQKETQKQKAAAEAAQATADAKKRGDEDKLEKLEKLILAQKDEQMKREAALDAARKAEKEEAESKAAADAKKKRDEEKLEKLEKLILAQKDEQMKREAALDAARKAEKEEADSKAAEGVAEKTSAEVAALLVAAANKQIEEAEAIAPKAADETRELTSRSQYSKMKPLPPPPTRQLPLHPPLSSSRTDDQSVYVDVPLNLAPVSEYPFAGKHSISSVLSRARESKWHADSTDVQTWIDNLEQDDAGQKDDVKKEDDAEKVDAKPEHNSEKADDAKQEDDTRGA
jgi:hypothetical protein